MRRITKSDPAIQIERTTYCNISPRYEPDISRWQLVKDNASICCCSSLILLQDVSRLASAFVQHLPYFGFSASFSISLYLASPAAAGGMTKSTSGTDLKVEHWCRQIETIVKSSKTSISENTNTDLRNFSWKWRQNKINYEKKIKKQNRRLKQLPNQFNYCITGNNIDCTDFYGLKIHTFDETKRIFLLMLMLN